jgi:hypothetical protein
VNGTAVKFLGIEVNNDAMEPGINWFLVLCIQGSAVGADLSLPAI